MAEANTPKAKPTATKPIADISDPDKTPSSGTSKPVLVTNRPIMKDPMVVGDQAAVTDNHAATSLTARSSTKSKIEPLTEPSTEPKVDEPEKVTAKAKATKEKAEPEPDKPDATVVETAESESGDKANPTSEAEEDAATAKQAEHDATIQKLVDSKQYFLAINSVEKRRSKRFVAAGILLSLLLALLWVDIALDAGLIHLSGIKPLTHFFSN